jgi:AAA+ superfamily predicted ATPase
VSWIEGMTRDSRYWILADTREIAERFLLAACEWCAEVRGEVLVFESGQWYKSEELFQAIQDTTFDNLILHGSLKEEIRDDLAHFFASREAYERYRVPWKRGILFIGPPGNGKTHTVKALINAMGQPCLYVKSFKADYHTDHGNIREVFRRARQTTPCVLVLEDLDSLIDGQNRSFFLNELDGFAANTGIVTLATSNHPERLDPAILERPSRFDRKYHFDLPGPAERLSYVRLWNETLEAELQLSDSGMTRIVELTEEFSFAYLKELFLSAMMQWIAAPRPGGMELLMESQIAALHEQMKSIGDEFSAEIEIDEDDDAFPPGISPALRRRMAAALRGRYGPR